MKKVFLLVTLLSLFCSCATVLNKSIKTIYITTTTPAKIVVNQDTILTYVSKVPIEIKRQPKDLNINVSNDSINKEVLFAYKNSFAYWLNIYPTPLFWTGFLIDKNNPKRYTYPKRIYFNMADTSNTYLSYDPRSRKGKIYLHISTPFVNQFLLKPNNEDDYKSSLGFWGLKLGLDFYHCSKQFINFSVSGIMDFFIPVPAAVDFSGYHTWMNSIELTVSNNHKIKNFLIGYGLCYAINTWELKYYDRFDPPPMTREPIKKSNYAIGIVFPMYYMPTEHFFIGIVYRPTLFRFNTENPFKYEHLISIDLGWKLNLKN